MKITKWFWHWILAISTDKLIWRVYYKDGRRTRLLRYSEASELADCFNGKLKLDHDSKYF